MNKTLHLHPLPLTDAEKLRLIRWLEKDLACPPKAVTPPFESSIRSDAPEQ